MEKYGLLARVEAKPGKEMEVLAFLKNALSLAQEEPDTVRWYALQLSKYTFGIFDTFEKEDGRKAHLSGKIAEALMAHSPNLLVRDPVIEEVDVLAIK